jgi:hypothetical protein
MPSLAVRIADQLVASLTAAVAGFVVPFTAARSWRPNENLEEISGVRVSVVPTNWSRQPGSRGDREGDFAFTVLVDRKLTGDDATRATQSDETALLAEEIARHLESDGASALAGTPDRIDAITFDKANDIAERGCFRQALRVTYPPIDTEGGA